MKMVSRSVCINSRCDNGSLSINIAPPPVGNLTAVDGSQMEDSTSSVTFGISWTQPHDRFGAFHYRLEFEAAHLDDYPMKRMRTVNTTTMNLTDGNLESFTFNGSLPYANYSITLTPFNIKLNRDGPSRSISVPTISIGRIRSKF